MELIPKSEFGKRLRLRRKARKMTLAEAAFGLGWDKTMLSKVEHGRRQITYVELERLAAVLGCTARDLIPPRRVA